MASDPSRAGVHNLSDPKYNCVWSVEVIEDAEKSEDIRALLQRCADHVAPLLRYRGWRVKRLIESRSKRFGGLCVGNGRADGDAASVNIMLNVRKYPDKKCTILKSFRQLLGVMMHEVTHVSIGLEDIHPPEFYRQMEENWGIYHKLKHLIKSTAGGVGENGEILEGELEGVAGGGGRGKGKVTGHVSNVVGEKRRPMLKGKKLVDGRSAEAKKAKVEKEVLSSRELALRAAERRTVLVKKEAKKERKVRGTGGNEVIDLCSSSEDEEEVGGVKEVEEVKVDDDDDNDDDDDDDADDEDELDALMSQECNDVCGCRSCVWTKELVPLCREIESGE
ncbi:hypothetical protein TL16_g05118, partial [Triparma laevis f. inornata]